MNVSLIFTRILFTILSIFFISVYTMHAYMGAVGIISGVIGGLVFGGFLILLDILFRRFNLRSFNVSILGLIFGYLMGQALVLIFHAIIKIYFTFVWVSEELILSNLIHLLFWALFTKPFS